MTHPYGVLLEAVSIQQYIFQSNILKTNLGASWLIQQALFDIHLREAVKQVCGDAGVEDWEAWKTRPDDVQIHNRPVEVGYIGGGNALLLFQTEADTRKVIEVWTRQLMLKTPGITTAVAGAALDLNDFSGSMMALHHQLSSNKSCQVPQTTLPRHGITAECHLSGLSAEVWNNTEGKYISSVADAKIRAVEPSREAFHQAFKDELGDGFCFPAEFEKLGSIHGEDSHIALVHIDGNRMARRFHTLTSLAATRKLSVSVHAATLATFRELVRLVVRDYDRIMADLGFDNYRPEARFQYPMDNDYQTYCLPLSPIILGGDDVTFVCDGKLGIYLAQIFMETFETQTVSDDLPLSACGGVAVIKTKYPFYRGYQLAEELCASAKDLNGRQEDPTRLGSHLDFQIAMAGVHGRLQDIRSRQYQAPCGNLLYRPYTLGRQAKTAERPLASLLPGVAELRNRAKFPRSKIKELREVLSRSAAAQQQYLQETRLRKRRLPGIP